MIALIKGMKETTEVNKKSNVCNYEYSIKFVSSFEFWTINWKTDLSLFPLKNRLFTSWTRWRHDSTRSFSIVPLRSNSCLTWTVLTSIHRLPSTNKFIKTIHSSYSVRERNYHQGKIKAIWCHSENISILRK